MMKKITILTISLLWTLLGHAQWESINPGAGGQVQDIVCDPNTPNRVFLASDMEGIYESLDNGQSWHPKGHLKQNRVYAVAVTPGNSNKMFVGTLYGLEVSSDGGDHFDLVGISKKFSIGAIAVSPSNPNLVIAAVGWRDDGDFAGNFGMSKNGQIITYRSTNGGSTWQQVNVGGSSERNVYSIQFEKNNANVAYMGTSQGVFKTTNGGSSWFALGGNPGTNTGVALSPNGQTLYGTFNHDLYVTSTSSINWQLKMSGLDGSANYWYPEVDPRSTGSSHKVTMAILGSRPGLYEGTFNWSGNNLSSYSWKKIWEGVSGYDTGWDQATPNPRVAHYTPTTWSRALWSTTNQTIFQATPNSSTWGWNWNNKYCIPNNNFNLGGNPTYASRGTASTYTYDIAMHDNYMIQTMADNGWVESWDGGYSWSNMQMRWKGQQSDAQSVDIGYDNGKYIAITESAPSCYGGACFTGGRLWTKILNTHSPSDEWVQVANSVKGAGGQINGGQYRDIAVSPVKRDRVFAASNDNGVYLIDDLWAAANGASNLQYIGMAGIRTKKIAPHPTNADVVFISSNSGGGQGVYKGQKNGGSWSFNKILDGSGWDAEVDVWEHNGQVYLFYFGNIGGEYKGMLSMDQGNSWNTVITSATAKGLNTPSWYGQVSGDFRFQSKGGIAGYDNKIIVNYYDHRQQQTYGVYRGTINGSNNVSWENWSGDIHFGGFTSARVKVASDGKRYFIASTAGAGAVRREIDGTGTIVPTSVSISGCSGSALSVGATMNLNETVSPSNATNKSVSWSSSNTSVATVSSSGLVTAVAAGSATITVTTNSGNKTATCGVTVSGGSGGGCSNPNLVSNGEFDSGVSDWNLYVNTGASANASSSQVSGAGLSGSQAAKVTISNGGGGNNDVQFYKVIGTLQSGKTYTVSFKAKSSSNRSITAGILKDISPWTGYKYETINLTNAVTDYSFEFAMSANESNARIDFFMGGGNPDVWIDAVLVQEKCEGGTGPILQTGVTISGCSGSALSIGATMDLDESVSPSNADDKSVTWSSSNTSVATVNGSGVVTAVAAGSATITVTTNSANKTASCNVTVSAPSGGNSLTIRARLTGGSSDNLQVRVNDNTVHTFSISGSSFANYTTSLSIAGNLKIYFPDNGTDIEVDYIIVDGVTYQAEDQPINTSAWQNGSCGGGGFSQWMHCPGYIDFGSLNGGGSNVSVSGVVIGNCSSPSLSVGATFDFNETVSPSNATNKSVTWNSSNTNVATVNGSGVVTTVSPGSANITVVTADGGFSAGCMVTVTGGGGASSYRYLRVTAYGTVQLESTIQQIHWLVGSADYPNPKITWNTQGQVTSSNNASNDYAAYDNTNGGWAVGTSYPAWITIDLGAGNEILPTEIQIKANAANRGFSAFDCHGSNDNSNWTMLHSESGLTSADYPNTWGNFSFGSSGRLRDAESEKSADLNTQVVYPNPLKQGQTLTILLQKSAQFVEIITLQGKEVLKVDVTGLDQYQVLIDERHFTSRGLYLIRIKSGDDFITKKLSIK
ncbi:Ig-like domain-containing protein [Reichenbachiella carrageenanivorans]|uniref:Ig-like domain-containing protein n=1 Tax=Reichenbachiella carrageenanivorans TaxID=2979869 RepID=A0ABY6D4F0_9BACT|nr:Ig-like domain-containing protein [Reichenbachiella carrageenanivorans]UXX81021.1 Ig-like domain-containing protein [Reichenbachiella carrageenanivorans]